jgi:3-keto-disaccharide hydrolase
MLVFLATLLAVGATSIDPAREALPTPAPHSVAATGRVLFSDDFSDSSLASWDRDREGVWSVRAGMLRADLPDRKQEHSFTFAGDTSWTDYTVDVDVCAMRGVDKGVAVRVEGRKTAVGVDLRGPGYQDVVMHVREWPLGKARAINPNGVWNHLRVEARGQRFRVWVNGSLTVDRLDSRHARPRGRIALAAYTGGVGECTVYYDNVVVTEAP